METKTIKIPDQNNHRVTKLVELTPECIDEIANAVSAKAGIGISIEPQGKLERKKGKWIDKGCGEYRCSSCRNIVELGDELIMSIKRFNFCPICGAYMKIQI